MSRQLQASIGPRLGHALSVIHPYRPPAVKSALGAVGALLRERRAKQSKTVDCFVRSKWRAPHRRCRAGSDATEHHAGRAVALWVSAFEILAHDGRRAELKSVLSLLAGSSWLTLKLRALDREVNYRKSNSGPTSQASSTGNSTKRATTSSMGTR